MSIEKPETECLRDAPIAFSHLSQDVPGSIQTKLLGLFRAGHLFLAKTEFRRDCCFRPL